MFADYISALILIVFAEMGDKTQFLAMAFATKYPVKKILLGIAIGSFLNHGLAMLLGRALLQFIPANIIGFIAGIMFLYFAFKSLELEEDEVEESQVRYGPVLTVALAFFLGELGDKTQLAALGLSIDAGSILPVLLGTVSGMIITSSLGIFIGIKLGKSIPENLLKIGAFLIFMVFGIQKIYSAHMIDLSTPLLMILGLLLLGVSLITVYFFNKQYQTIQTSAFLRQAEKLKNTKNQIVFKVESMCKGTKHCGVCDGQYCLVGYMRHLVQSETPMTDLQAKDITRLKNKSFDINEAKVILGYLMTYFDSYPVEFMENDTLLQLRHTIEYIIMGKMISTPSYDDYKREIKHHI